MVFKNSLETNDLLSRIFTWLQFDKSLSLALVARFWQAFSGPVTIALQVRALTLPEQGIYIGILSIVAVQPLFELGLANVLIGQAGNVAARIQRSDGSSKMQAQAELHWLARTSLHWFLLITLLYSIGAMLMGWKVLSGSGTAIADWRLPLTLTVALSAISFAVSPRVYILEGAGEREFVYRVRLLQAVVGSLVVWLALLLGLKLWAVVAIFFVSAAFNVGVAFGGQARRLLAQPLADRPNSQLSWLLKIWPLQWRVAATSAAHYLASQLMFIYVLNYHGSTVAAPLGMTLQITAAIQSLALAWAQTKFPLISQHQAGERREFAGTLWRQTALVSSGLLGLAIIVLAILVWGLPIFGRGWEARFVSPPMIILLGIGFLANHLLALQCYYVLSRGAKPFALVTLIGLLFTALAVWFGGREFAVAGVIGAYTLGMAAVTVPLHTWAYLKFRSLKN